MNRTFPLILNSILFLAGICSIAFDQPVLSALCLLSISLLFIWKPRTQQLPDDLPADDDGMDNKETDFQQLELSLRIQELTESNRLLNEELDRLRREQETCLHPLYSCPLTSALPINLDEFFTDYVKNRFDTDRSSRVHPKFHCSVPEAETYLRRGAEDHLR